MSHIRVPRGVKGNIPFRTKDRPGGSLVDDYQWVNGLTAAEWPVVTIRNALDADVTADWDVDIALDTFPGGSIKHPTTTTGIWRLSKGQYRLRAQPNGSLPFGDYEMEVAFDTSATTAYTEEHTLTLIDAGDVEFGDLVFAGLTWDDLTAVVSSSITDPAQQELILAEMASTVEGELQMCGIDTTVFEELPKPIRAILLAYGRLLIFTYDGSAGAIISEIGELSEKVKFTGRGVTDGNRFLGEYLRLLGQYCKQNAPGRQPMLGAVVRDVGHTVQG